MADLIDKERALNCFHCWIDKWGDVHEPDEMSEYRAIEALPSVEPEPQWIPCSEQLPEEDGDYLVTYDGEYAEEHDLDLIGVAPFEVDSGGFGVWQVFGGHMLGILSSDWVEIKVVAWMPLPEAYNGEE